MISNTRILGHRGDLENYSSNTKESVLSAFALSDGVEIDINISKDNIFFFYHEEDWPTGGKILARNMDISEIRDICPNGETVLTLQEALSLAHEHQKILCIHMELGGGGRRWTSPLTGDEIKQLLKIIDESRISKELIMLHTTSPRLARSYYNEGYTVFLRGSCIERRGMYRFNEYRNIVKNKVDLSKSMAYTLNSRHEIGATISKGFGYILTDNLSLTKPGLWGTNK